MVNINMIGMHKAVIRNSESLCYFTNDKTLKLCIDIDSVKDINNTKINNSRV